MGMLSSLIKSVGTKGEGTLASKLGAAMGEKAIQESIGAEEKALAAITKLKEQGIPVYKADIETLTKTATENPKLSSDDLVQQFAKETEPKPVVTAIQEPYKGVAQPPEVKMSSGEAYPLASVEAPPAKVPGTSSLPSEYLAEAAAAIPKAGSKMKTAAGVGTVLGAATASGYYLVRDDKTGKIDTVKAPTESDVEKPKQVVAPAPASVGGEVPSTSESKMAQTEPVRQPKSKPQQTAASAQASSETLEDKLRAGKDISRGDLLSVLDQIKQVQVASPEINEADKNQFIQARARAYQAYKEKADRNEWLEVAQNLTNALATYAAGSAGVAHRGLSLPSIDYGARTGQALRAYEAETGIIGEQERAAEREKERQERFGLKEAELKRQGLENVLRLGEQAVSAQERKASQERDLATRLELHQLRQAAEANKAAEKRAKEEKSAQQSGSKQLYSWLNTDIKNTNTLLAQKKAELQAATAVTTAEKSDEFGKALNNFLARANIRKEEMEEKGWWGGVNVDKEKAQAAAAARAAQLNEEISKLTQQRDNSIAKQKEILGGVTPPSQPSTTSAGGGTVDMVAPDGRLLKVPASEVARLEAAGAKRK